MTVVPLIVSDTRGNLERTGGTVKSQVVYGTESQSLLERFDLSKKVACSNGLNFASELKRLTTRVDDG